MNLILLDISQTTQLKTQEIDILKTLIPEDIQKRMSEAFHLKTKKQIFYSYLLKYYFISQEIKKPISEVVIEYSPFGKPFVKQDNQKKVLYFNLSHSDEKLLLALDFFPLGLDIEKNRQFSKNFSRLILKFSKEEQKIFEDKNLEEKAELFLRLWTLKESFLKCLGMGLRVPLSSFTLQLYPTITLLKNPYKEEKFFFKEYTEENYTLALCSQNPQLEISWKRLNAQSFLKQILKHF